jgi:hypothetical protein
MPYVIKKLNGKVVKGHYYVLSQSDLNNWRNSSSQKDSLTIVSSLTKRQKTVYGKK